MGRLAAFGKAVGKCGQTLQKTIKMKKSIKGSNSSMKVADSLNFKAITLSSEQTEAIRRIASIYEGVGGSIEITCNGVSVFLSFQGKFSKEELAVEKKIFSGKVELLVDTLWVHSVEQMLLRYYSKQRENHEVIPYEDLRHQMLQMSRGYTAKAKAAKAEEKAAYRKIANKLQLREATREMLGILNNIKSVNTFEVLKGQGGRIRIALYL